MFCVLLHRRVVSAFLGICSFISMKYVTLVFTVNSPVNERRRKFHGKGFSQDKLNHP